MRINPDQLHRHLQKELLPLYAVSGDEPLLVTETADLVRSAARAAGYTEREILTVDHRFNWPELWHSSHNLSLFASQRIMDIRIPSGKPGIEGGAALESYCHSLPADTITLVTLPATDRQGQATKWFKALEQAGVMISVSPVDRSHLTGWIRQRLLAQQQQADSAALQFLADRTEGNLLAAHQEIHKLALLYPAGTLSFEQIKDAVLDVARYDVYQLPEAMMTHDTVRYIHILEGLRAEGTALPLILATLVAQIRSLITLRKGLDAGRPLAQLMTEARIWGDRQKIAGNLVKRVSLKQLITVLLQAARADRINKGAAKGDPWETLLQLGLGFPGRTPHK